MCFVARNFQEEILKFLYGKNKRVAIKGFYKNLAN